MDDNGAALVAALRRHAERFPEVLGRALHQEALVIMGDSERQMPAAAAAAGLTHETTPPEFDGPEIAVRIVVSGPDALEWHEDVAGAGGAKFLERALLEAVSAFPDRFSARVARDGGL